MLFSSLVIQGIGRAFQSDQFTETDRNWMNPYQEEHEYEVWVLQKHCEELGMDCSTFFLSHNDLGPTNIVLNGERITVL